MPTIKLGSSTRLKRAQATQVVSTSSTPSCASRSGTFIDTLYYRLNTVCVDVTT